MFGVEEEDINELDKAILKAIFSGMLLSFMQIYQKCISERLHIFQFCLLEPVFVILDIQ